MIHNGRSVPLSSLARSVPAVSNPQIEKLLWIERAERIVLPQGDTCRGDWKPGEFVIVAVKGKINTICGLVQGSVISGQVFAVVEPECRFTAEEESECAVITLSGSLIEMVLGEQIRSGMTFYPSAFAEVMQTISILRHDEKSAEMISSAAYQLLLRLYQRAEYYSEAAGYPLLVEAAVGMIQDEFATIEGLDEIAERLEVTTSYLIRLFSQTVGVPPGRYLKLRRLEYAKSLLLQTDMTVSLAADLSGFSGANYFAKVFRKEFGITPSEYALVHRTDQADFMVHHTIDESVL
ncbi:MAG: helix-turn-helix transcriptional regulator [Butyricicoccaceae bacterium]